MSVSGCILGYQKISDEMKDDVLLKLIHKIGYDEGLKVVVNPGVLNPKDFIDEVVNERLPNPAIPDTPQRIATDTSQKVGVRFGNTIKAYVQEDNLDEKSLTGVSLALAAWLRYLLGVDDSGKEFKLSSDPLLEDLKKIMAEIKYPNTDRLSLEQVEKILNPLLSNQEIFGLDLTKTALGNMISKYFYDMISEKGSFRKTLAMNLER